MSAAGPASVAVVGAGVAGSAAARVLADRGFDVTVFDKGRGPGGRTSTRREGGFDFDHGAPFFDAGGPSSAIVTRWVETGVVAPWNARLHGFDDDQRYVAVPGMSALCDHLCNGVTVIPRVRVTGARRAGKTWKLQGEYASELGEFDVLVVATPPKQAAAFLTQATGLKRMMRGVVMSPRWAVMAAFAGPVEVDWDAASFPDLPVALAVRNGAKPGRPAGEAWVLHASADWTRAHVEGDPHGIAERLLHEFFAAVGVARPQPHFVAAHRWRYAIADEPAGEEFLWDGRVRIGVCADWCVGGGVAGAYASGTALGERIAQLFG